ncbi:threonine synthase [Aerococcaceae bacterium DSM 111020]|nr:threonine synthase [Aerococcaceae bacterium DSM 111020]
MLYKSTRNPDHIVTASQAILQGLASDGGLYVPTEIHPLSLDWNELQDFSYQQMATFILKEFLGDFTETQIRYCVNGAYDDGFDHETIAPLKKADGHYYLELFHGETIAFKDMALSILPYLMTTANDINHNEKDIVILTATSGDTGKAAMAGFADVPGTQIIVFYPHGGVSSIQERQMLTQEGNNTHVFAIQGNFDDAQKQVKDLFNDQAFNEELKEQNKQFSSANSMNIGRLVPQVVYYFFAYAQLVKQGEIEPNDKVDFSVPTGNFGNILAAYYAKQLGLPIGNLICASNDNNVLTEFFETGIYNTNREFILTISPSMDILISSNFERLLYHALGDYTPALNAMMNHLKEKGSYQVTEETLANFSDFLADFATEEETLQEIRDVYQNAQYVIDPHTAVASKVARKLATQREDYPLVIVSTASPYKFPEAVLNALNINTDMMSDDEMLNALKDITHVDFPPAITSLNEKPANERTIIPIEEMKASIRRIIAN